jgi:hypothetical protein
VGTPDSLYVDVLDELTFAVLTLVEALEMLILPLLIPVLWLLEVEFWLLTSGTRIALPTMKRERNESVEGMMAIILEQENLVCWTHVKRGSSISEHYEIHWSSYRARTSEAKPA